jgi:hypothetical protein
MDLCFLCSYIVERISQKSNEISGIIQQAAANGKYIVLLLAFVALLSGLFSGSKIINSGN